MSEDATISFGYDGAQLAQGLSESERRIVRFASRAETSMQAASGKAQQFERSISKVGGGGAMRNMGQMSMQLQDIAVQLQSGTRASIVFAQQGSQMLSAFGPAGAVVGAVAAIGGALYMAKEKADETFKEAIKRAESFRLQNARLVRESKLDNLAEGFRQVREEVENLNAAEKSLSSIGGKLSTFFSGQKSGDRRAAIQDQRTQVAATSGQMLRQVLDLSEQEVQVSDMLAAGKEKEAAALMRQLELEKKIAEIKELNIVESSKAQLISDLTRKAANVEKTIAGAAAKQERERLWQMKDAMETRRRSIEYAKDELAISTLEADGRHEDAKRQRLDLLEKRKFADYMGAGMSPGDALSMANKDRANEAMKLLDAEKKLVELKRIELKNAKETRDSERKSVEILEAESKGQERKLKKLQEEEYARRRMKDLIAEGFGPKEAESITAREIKARKELEKYQETGRAHIGGIKKKTMMGSQFHGLDEFARLQEKDYEPSGPTRPGYRRGQPVPRYDAFGESRGSPTSAQRNGRYMGGDRAGTRGYNTAEVIRNNQMKNSGSEVAEKIERGNALLAEIKEGIV